VIYVLKHADGREVGRSRFPIQIRDGQWWSLDSLWLDPVPGDGSTVETRPDVPSSVTARQAVEALIRIGITEDMVEAAIDAIADPAQRLIARNLWRRSNDFERQNQTLIALAKQALGMTDDQLDQLFITADTL
jgi:hypothetical protein